MGFNFAFLYGLIRTDQPMIQSRLADFQFGNTELSKATPWALLLGYQRYSNRLEVELLVVSHHLDGFLSAENEFYIDTCHLLLWYRRDFHFRLGRAWASLLPGAGIGYSSATAAVGSAGLDAVEVLEASETTYGLGVRFDLQLVHGQGTKGHSFIDMILDYSYRFDDMPAKTINEGEFFFPTPTEFALQGHYLALGIQVRFW